MKLIPYVAVVCRIIQLIADCLKHLLCCGNIAAIGNLKNNVVESNKANHFVIFSYPIYNLSNSCFSVGYILKH